VRRTLAAARTVQLDLQRVGEAAPRVAALASPLPPRTVDQRLGTAVEEDTGELLDSASPGLGAARRGIQVARERLLRRLEAILKAQDAQVVPAGATVTVRGGRYVIPVRRDARGRPDGIVHDESGSAGTLFIEPTAAIELGNALRAAHAAEQQEALKVLRELTEMLRPCHAELAGAHEMCVAVDDLVARARYAQVWGAAVPAISESGAPLVLCRARHPLLLARLAEVVPFELDLDSDQRTLLVSGPNTGGKTVLLKTVGLAVLLVQAGIVPPLGKGSSLPVCRRVFADIGDHQSIAADLSTFSAHVALLRQVLEVADHATLVLLDEVGSGTDPVEGAALAGAALRSLTDRRALTIATTHLGSLKTLAGRVPGVVNGSLQFDTATLSPSYRFHLGVPGRSYGLAIARRLGLAAAVLAEAEGLVPAGERDLEALLAAAEARDQELAERLAALGEREADAAAQADRITAREALLGRREGDLLARERDAERRAREVARSFLLEARTRVEEAIGIASGAAEESAAREARRLVEEGVQAEGAAIEALSERELAGAGGPILVGRRVRSTAGALGTVIEIRSDGRLVVKAGAMRMVVPADQVEVIGGESPAAERTPRVGAPAERDLALVPMEIDLRGFRADEAEAAAVAALDAAVLAEHPHLRIIHGMGTGAVRERVQRVLRADRRVTRFGFAPARQGGTGVTVVEFGA
jgi:DNA mismatch repair protein MutS2